MNSSSFRGLSGKTYSVGQEIGHGGEGSVSTISDNSLVVIKIYNEKILKEKIEKLESMVLMGHPDLFTIAAWPTDIVKNGIGEVCGFTMNKLVNYYPLHMLFSPMDRKKIFPDKGYNFLAHVARNLATAFQKLHSFNIVVGDVNEANILVNSLGMVVFIDCDSFQIQRANKTYYCEVGVPRYTAPEILSHGTFENYIRTKNTDNFALATLIFQILFLGRAPFTGISPSNIEFDEGDAIMCYDFAYSLRKINKALLPARDSLDIKMFPTKLTELFHKAFESSNLRPNALEWIESLDELVRVMVVCRESKLHFYPRNAQNCPWCQFRSQRGIVFFLDDIVVKNFSAINDIDQFIQGIRVDPIYIKQLSTEYPNQKGQSQPIEKRFSRMRLTNRIVISAIWIFCIPMIAESLIFPVIGLICTWLFNSFFPTKRIINSELNKRREVYKKAKIDFENTVTNHNNPSQLQQYNISSDKLRSLVSKVRDLPNEFTKRKKEIEEKNYQFAYQQYLRNFLIKDYSIPKIGPNKKNWLSSSGVRNAADITKLHGIKIDNIGPKNIQLLLDWQRQIGSSFVYTPNLDLINRELNLVANDMSGLKRRLENEIKGEYANHQQLKQSIETLIKSIENQYDRVGMSLQQLRLDSEHFERFAKF